MILFCKRYNLHPYSESGEAAAPFGTYGTYGGDDGVRMMNNQHMTLRDVLIFWVYPQRIVEMDGGMNRR
jgi:hypothetical protein